MKTLEYVAVLDTLDPKGRFWPTGITRKLTPEKAAPNIAKNRIRLVTAQDRQPKRFVELHKANGEIENLTWGEYLKRKRSF